MESRNHPGYRQQSIQNPRSYVVTIYYFSYSAANLTEFQVRELNDEINRMFKTKYHWEFRIRELGGPDYIRKRPKVLDADGREVPGTRGYKYFGRARELPGVKELFAARCKLGE
jgi:hypothetical protein